MEINTFLQKTIIKKIIIAILFVLIFNFTFSYLGSNVVFASETVLTDEEMEATGGKFFVPITEFILFLADSVLQALQNSFLSHAPIIIEASSDELEDSSGWFWIAIGVVAIVAGVISCGVGIAAVASAGAAATGFIATTTAVAGAVLSSKALLVGGVLVAGGIYAIPKGAEKLTGEFNLPNILYTPESIFSNRIPLFNINFFNPKKYKDNPAEFVKNNNVVQAEIKKREDALKYCMNFIESYFNQIELTDFKHVETWKMDIEPDKDYELKFSKFQGDKFESVDDIDLSNYIDQNTQGFLMNSKFQVTFTGKEKLEDMIKDYWMELNEDVENEEGIVNAGIWCENGSYQVAGEIGTQWLDRTGYYETLEGVSRVPFKHDGKSYFSMTHAYWYNSQESTLYNLMSASYGMYEYRFFLFKVEIEPETIGTEVEDMPSSSQILQNTVSSIYKSLRIVAIVALLTILVYVGIRMVISSASKDKAKYKQMLMDWLVAFILLFVLHYLMTFIIYVSEELTNICNENNVENIPLGIPPNTKIKDRLGREIKLSDENGWAINTDTGEVIEGTPAYWGTNFIGFIRYYAGLTKYTGITMKALTYLIMYIALVIYLVMFTFQYMRRVLFMAFLTMISPLVAITYPLDKIHDGKAQGFNMWLKEYIFNALLQPIHYIIYIIIMGSILDLVIDYPVYALVAVGFMIPAEKFIRKMFGFEKASTVGSFGAAAGAAALMSGIQSLRHNPKKDESDDNGAKGKKGNPNGKTKTMNSMPEKTNADNSVSQPAIPPQTGGTSTSNSSSNGANNNSSPNIPGSASPRTVSNNSGGETATINSNNLRINSSSGINRPSVSGGAKNGGKSRFKRKLNSMGNGIKAAWGHNVRREVNRAKKSHPLRTIRRAVTFGAGAFLGGLIGLAAGIASGDPSKVLKYGAAGGMAGGALTKNVGETASNSLDLKGNYEAYQRGALGEEYDERKREDYKTDFKNNVSNYDAAVGKVGSDGWEEMSKEGGIIDTALDYGITNIDDMTNIYKTQQELKQRYNFSDKEAMDYAFLGYDLNSKFGKYSSDSKVNENMDKLLKRRGFSDEAEREAQKQGMLNIMRLYQINLGEEDDDIKVDYSKISIL